MKEPTLKGPSKAFLKAVKIAKIVTHSNENKTLEKYKKELYQHTLDALRLMGK